LSTRDGAESGEKTLFAKKFRTQIHEAEQPRKPFEERKVMC